MNFNSMLVNILKDAISNVAENRAIKHYVLLIGYILTSRLLAFNIHRTNANIWLFLLS